MRYNLFLIEDARKLRTQGKTYGEIRTILKLNIPKSTLSEWCKKISLPATYSERITKLNLNNLNKARLIALEINKIKREEFLRVLDQKNLSISKEVRDYSTAKIALAMLCLGEASKYNSKTAFCLGSSDPRIIIIFLELLKKCFNFNIEKVRCTLQCRADQDIRSLEEFWMNVTKIPKRLFYKARIDPRTIGKPTKKTDYKGVLKVNYFDTKVQLELESLAKLVYNQLAK
ncbi:MAG: hypothetical protein HYU49_01145 [Candidatus Levybacteria bacterium]|nr:hypothetical protein [Candidatus Levybacteria bacterium]MBI2622625.1 hypothetical protein [Candidatus Levybacteria bacterium]MBI3092758.1 hypothetical protein [Candidatus Levybacteria bacterium]